MYKLIPCLFLLTKLLFHFFIFPSCQLGLDRRLAANRLGSFVTSLRFTALALQRTRPIVSPCFDYIETDRTEGAYLKDEIIYL